MKYWIADIFSEMVSLNIRHHSFQAETRRANKIHLYHAVLGTVKIMEWNDNDGCY